MVYISTLTCLDRVLLCRYLAPEYVENGIVSVRSDVYSFGIVLVQLISGRKVVESNAEHHRLSLRQWVCSSSFYDSYYMDTHLLYFKYYI